jgi:hypothetical protein
MTDLASSLLNFTPISLKEMDHVKLLDRIDTKYVINSDLLEEYLALLQDKYKILSIDGVLVHPYETLYYDTPDFHLYRMHHNGRQNRYKIRFRKYVNSDLAFFEIKSKTNTHRTIKKRIPVEHILETLNDPLNSFISNHTPGAFRKYIPVLRVFFNRITLVNNNANERLTIDTDIRYISKGEEKIIESLVIVEVKQEKHCISPFQQLMQGKRQRSNYISKYCLGVVCMNRDVKKNRFKHRLNILNKLGYDFH